MFVVTHSECLDERGVTWNTFSREKYQLQIGDDDVTKSFMNHIIFRSKEDALRWFYFTSVILYL